MGRHTVGLVGTWDVVAFDEVAGINMKDKDGIQIMKGYMANEHPSEELRYILLFLLL